jgi:hypothetical protein
VAAWYGGAPGAAVGATVVGAVGAGGGAFGPLAGPNIDQSTPRAMPITTTTIVMVAPNAITF